MKRATVISGAALIVTTSLIGCGPSESEAAPTGHGSGAAPRPPVFVENVVSERPGAPEPVRAAAADEIGIIPRDALVDMGTETLERRSLLDRKLSVLVPRSFTEMGPVMLQAKYPSQNRPSPVLTNESGAVNIAINYTNSRVKPKELRAAFNVIRAQLRNAYPTAQWYTSELTTIHGQAFFRMDFRTPAVDTEVRNIMVGTILEGRLLLISFNTTRELEDTWAPIGEAIVASIELE